MSTLHKDMDEGGWWSEGSLRVLEIQGGGGGGWLGLEAVVGAVHGG